MAENAIFDQNGILDPFLVQNVKNGQKWGFIFNMHFWQNALFRGGLLEVKNDLKKTHFVPFWWRFFNAFWAKIRFIFDRFSFEWKIVSKSEKMAKKLWFFHGRFRAQLWISLKILGLLQENDRIPNIKKRRNMISILTLSYTPRGT